MGKDKKLIMVVNREDLFERAYFEGFRLNITVDYKERILKHFEYLERGVAEKDTNFKQPIAYSMIVNPGLRKVFAYQRASQDHKYSEKRLQGKWSWGVGGHIEKFEETAEDPIYTSMLRELQEEVEIENPFTSDYVLGYINDDSDEVGQVHFGILNYWETNSTIIRPKDPEIEIGELKSIEELEEICDSSDCVVENWSRIALDPLKKLFLCLSTTN